ARLEDRLHLMVRRPPGQEAKGSVRAGSLREAAEEILEQFRLHAANVFCREFPFAHEVRTPTKVDRRRRESLVHRHQKISGTQNAALRAQGLAYGFAENNACILNRVVL